MKSKATLPKEGVADFYTKRQCRYESNRPPEGALYLILSGTFGKRAIFILNGSALYL
jgi:hypothetical protein